ncbi:hypothetical protein B0T13DRAFT_465658 [Neurospora crassa]|nr:hypothetical protein B0T13DRAFT_465658 [Neurospora crassa]
MQRRIIWRLWRTSSEFITTQTNFLVFTSTPMFIFSPSHVRVRAAPLMREQPTYNSTGYKLLHIFNTFIRSFQHKEKQKRKKEEEEENRPDHTFSFVASSLCRVPPVVLPFPRNKNPFYIYKLFFFFPPLAVNEHIRTHATTKYYLDTPSCVMHLAFFTTTLPVFRAGAPMFTSLHIDGERGHTHTWTQTYRQELARGMVFSSFFFFFFLAFFFFCWLDFFWALVPINPVHSFDCRTIVAANSGASAVRFDTQRFFFFF